MMIKVRTNKLYKPLSHVLPEVRLCSLVELLNFSQNRRKSAP